MSLLFIFKNSCKKLLFCGRNTLIKKMSNLAVFDFDHTIISENSDVVVANLLPKERMTSSLKALHKKEGWTRYMQTIFEYLYKDGFTEESITETVKEIQPLNGMELLIRHLKDHLQCDIIIISDSNSVFIDKWLVHRGLSDKILKVFTNPSEFIGGMLHISMYHYQNTCNLSTKNLCKGRVLEEFIESQSKEGISYGKVLYVGDGLNDFCPILRLREQDVACARKDFKCANMLNSILKGDVLPETGEKHEIKPRIIFFEDGNDLLTEAKSHLNSKVDATLENHS